jgi:DNA-directed RNA polymerase subunit RPC12/RpoP
MAEKKCVKCGKAYDEEAGEWYECPECDAVYCPECIEELEEEHKQRVMRAEDEKIKQSKEKKRMEEIPHANLDRYKQLICPRCETEMMPF